VIKPNQKMKVKIGWCNIQKYQELGYNCSIGDELVVPLEDGPNSSRERVIVICDRCGLEYEISVYSAKRKHKVGHLCGRCKGLDLRDRNEKKYGTPNTMQVPELADKANQSKIDRYGSKYPAEWKERQIKTKIEKYGEDYGRLTYEKAKKTNIQKYGYEHAMQNPEIYNKYSQTCMSKYGVLNTSSLPETRKKVEQTVMERYGKRHISQVPVIREKQVKTLMLNGTQKTSSQQIELFDAICELYPDYNIYINYQFRNFNYDVAMIDEGNDIFIDIEYDGYHWHQDSQKDRRRDEFVKSQGWKVLRIKSGHKLPTNDQLKEAVERLLNGFSFAQIILDDWKEESKDEQFVDSISE